MEMAWLRMLSAFMVGFLLVLTGSITQFMTENKLASPSTLGVDALGVTLVLFLFVLKLFGVSFPLEIQWVMILGLSWGGGVFIARYTSRGYLSGFKDKIVFLGLAINLMIGAIFALVQFTTMAYGMEFPNGLWFGQIYTPSNREFLLLSLGFGWIVMLLLKYWRHLLSLGLGHDLLLTLRWPLETSWRVAINITLLSNLLVIWLFGVFSFMGLILPPLLRHLPGLKGQPKNELRYGPVLGGVIFLILDSLCYHFTFFGAEIPVGLLTSVIGAVALVILSFKKIIQSQ